MKRSRTRPAAALTAVAAALALTACGSSSSSSSAASGGASSSSSSSSSSSASSSKPGAGKPAVVIGDKNFTEEYILGDLYQQALQAEGYKVTLKGNIGSSEITWKALTSGQIQLYPEYDGTLLTAIAGVSAPPTSAQAAYTEAKAYAQKHGFTLLNPTPFFDTDALVVPKAYAAAHHLTTIADLKPLGASVKLGGAPEFQTRQEGLVGLKRAYGIDPTFVPLAIGLTYKALDSGQVQVADGFSTDPPLITGKYRILTDPKNVFGFQYVTPVVKQSLLSSEGPAFAQTLDKVDSLLTQQAIQKMNAAVALDQQSPATVAHEFLAANGLA
jgi:osmoprotectant transport system substrate-binding protein